MYKLTLLTINILVLLGLAGASFSQSAPADKMQRYTIVQSNHPEAVCNDGTTPVFYYRRGVGDGVNKWVLWFKGGGSCYDDPTCSARASSLTSSDPWMTAEFAELGTGGNSGSADGRADGIISPFPATNPDFFNWNHVYLVYCSSDLWSGTRPASPETNGRHFKGHFIVDAMVDALMDSSVIGEPNMSSATNILLTGSSAGAEGLQNNVDRLAEMLSFADVRAVSDAGVTPRVTPALQQAEKVIGQKRLDLWQPVLDEDCMAVHTSAEEAILCLSSPHRLAHGHISTPMFVHQDQFDSKIIATVDPADPNAKAIIDSTAAAIRDLLSVRDGVFSPAAGFHIILNEERFNRLKIPGDRILGKFTPGSVSSQVDSFTIAEVLGNWYFGRSGATNIIELPEENTSNVLDFTTGRNNYEIRVDGAKRQFIVYVPTGYDPNTATPLVFMFHGTTGDGAKMYNISGWVGKAETENIIAVFPSSWRYFITTKGVYQTKWNSVGLLNVVAEGTDLKDDVKFVQQMLDLLRSTFNIDTRRTFASGFSNGAGFVNSRLLIEMPDQFGALATGVGLLPVVFEPKDNELLPLYVGLGSKDSKQLEKAGRTEPFPMDPLLIMQEPYLRNFLDSVLETLDLDSLYQVQAERPNFVTMIFNQSLIGAGNEFRFRMVKDMDHKYANGHNHPSGLSYPDLFWEFFLQHPRTDPTSSVESQQSPQPDVFTLEQNYPNPFNPATTITYSVEKAGQVELKIYDLLGREVRSLVNENRHKGQFSVVWNGKDNFGKQVASGHYYYQITTEDFSEVKKMLLVK